MQNARRLLAAYALACGLFCALVALAAVALLLPPTASAAPPHVVTRTDTDACAICHRAHSAASSVPFRDRRTLEETRNSLVVGQFRSDSELCYTCHGLAAVGSMHEVESEFSQESSHSLDTTSAFGPSPKRCGSCHDSHGLDRRADGTPYPSLLRAYEDTNTPVFRGDAYCATCHKDRVADGWDGLSVWRQTAHATIATSAAGGDILCSACHAPHGSPIAPMIAEEVYPSSGVTVTVAGNDRTQCFACHLGAETTYPGRATYQVSAHGASDETLSVGGEWADRMDARKSTETSRAIGECQTCHAPMGRKGADGNAIPEMLEKPGRALCDTCHRAGSSTNATDIASLAYPPAEATAVELIASFEPSAPTAFLGSIGVWSRETTGALPRDLLGAREYRVEGRAGAVAVGAIEGDGVARLVVADVEDKELEIYSPSAISGVERSATYGLGAIVPDFVAVGDVVLDGSGRPEIAVVDKAAGNVYVYRREANGLTLLSTLSIGGGASSIAVGDVRGSDRVDLAITSVTQDTLFIIAESGGAASIEATVATRPGPTGASIGDVNDAAGNEIVVANSGVPTDNVSVFPGSGAAALASYDATGIADAQAVDTLVADVLPDSPGAELAVALRPTDPSAASMVALFPRTSPGLGARQEYVVSAGANTAELASGDLDGDGVAELVAGNAGVWSRTNGTPPSVWVFQPTAGGGALDPAATRKLYSGGVERAGEAPSLAVADLGAVGPSRHPVDQGSHVSTETAPIARHVTCADCHNPHEATATPAAAPAVYGPLKGASGVSMESTSGGRALSAAYPVQNEYEVCLKCHSAGWSVAGTRDIASEIATTNASVHAVAAPSTSASIAAGTFAPASPAWSEDSVLYCVDCHSNSDASAAAGPHVSAKAPLLRKPYFDVMPSSTTLLCYSCHKREVYYEGDQDAGASASGFRSGATKLHEKHVEALGFGCVSCHASHGSETQLRLIRDEAGFTPESGGGKCANSCHSTGTPANTHAY